MPTQTKIIQKKRIAQLVALCSIAYFVSYLTRVNYAAVLVEIIRTENFTRQAASVALTGLFITYGAGQIVSGRLGDRYSPEKIVFTGLLLAAAMNFLIPFCPTPTLMTVVWCINGFAQALMWPPIVAIFTRYLQNETYRKTVIFVGWGGNTGAMVVYLLVPALLSGFSWRSVFFVCGTMAVIMAVVWITVIGRIESYAEPVGSDEAEAAESSGASDGPTASLKKKVTALVVGYLALTMIAIVAQGVLRDGISTWMPSYISEQFDLGSGVSILTGVGLPIFSILTTFIASNVNRKLVRNENLCAAVFFVICTVCTLILCFSYQQSPILSVILLTLANGSTHGINLMFTCMIVPYFAKYGRASFVAGILNSATYVGSALSTYGIAAVTDRFGWGGTMFVWCAAGVIGIVICLLTVGALNRMKK